MTAEGSRGHRGKIIEKEYGKTKIYFADQNQFPSVSKEELISMEEQMNALKEEEKALIAQSNMLKTGIKDSGRWYGVELKNLQNALPDDQLQAAIEQFTKENEQMTTKLETLRKYVCVVVWAIRSSGAIDKTQLESLQSNVNKYTKLWKQRRSMCIEGVKMLADGLEKKDSEIMVCKSRGDIGEIYRNLWELKRKRNWESRFHSRNNARLMMNAGRGSI